MFNNKFAYLFMLFFGLLICSIIDPGFFLGMDNQYSWLSWVFFGVCCIASGPYAWYTCSKTADRIVNVVRPPIAPNESSKA